ncbi:MAG: peptidase M3, partial [Pseudomonadota bacterium]
MTANPLISPPKRPFDLTAFETLEPHHFTDAFDKAFETHLAEIDAIATADTDPTFENTIEALDRAGRDLTRVAMSFFCITGAHTNEELQRIERDIAPKIAAHSNAISMNAVLFARVDAVYTGDGVERLTSEQQRLAERTHRGFVRSGAKLEENAKARFAEI